MITDTTSISIDDFDYPLPDHRIARHPLADRDRCLLMVRRPDGTIEHSRFDSLPSLLPSDSILVANNTRVINARLRFRKGDDRSGARIEVFCLEPIAPADYERSFASTDGCEWTCFVGNSKRWTDGLTLSLPVVVDGMEVELRADRTGRSGNASTVRFSWTALRQVTFSQIISAAGEIPIPPYLGRNTESSDSSDYQTVYSRIEGSVAAPTAGLHFTPELLDSIACAGIPRREVTLHVGAGTFQPVKSDTIGHHEMHSELIVVDRSLISELASTDRRVVAVGTTSVRTLESLYHLGCMAAQGLPLTELPQWYPYSPDHPELSVADALQALLSRLDAGKSDRLVASTRIIIAPGYRFRIVRGMVTNFHQPRSTLLLLVSAFTGGDWRRMYDEALHRSYRFLSYGDAQLLLS